MSVPQLLLFGAGGHARACIDVIETHGQFEIAGLLGRPHEIGTRVLGYEVIGSDDQLPSLVKRVPRVLIAFGQIETAMPRVRLFESLVALGCELPVIVSPRAHVSRHASIGAGTIVMHGAVVNAAATIGVNTIVNNQALVEHDAHIGDHCHVSTGALINGAVRVGHRTFVGSGAIVRQGIVIGNDCVIGMGQSVLSDCADSSRLPPVRA